MGKFFAGFVAGSIITPAVIVGAGIAYLLVTNRQNDSHEELPPPLLPTTGAEYDWSIYSTDGEEIPLTNFQGKTVFLTFFSPTCSVCLSELPALQGLYDSLRDDGAIAFLLVATEKEDRLATLAAEHKLTMPLYYEQGLPEMYKRGGLVPRTYMLAPDGSLALFYRGAAAWDHPSVLDYLRGLSAPSGG